jgi:hypothetical protein
VNYKHLLRQMQVFVEFLLVHYSCRSKDLHQIMLIYVIIELLTRGFSVIISHMCR